VAAAAGAAAVVQLEGVFVAYFLSAVGHFGSSVVAAAPTPLAILDHFFVLYLRLKINPEKDPV